MTQSRQKLNIKASSLFLILAVLIGGYIRLVRVLQSPFPLNDGGLFYTMTRDLMANGWRIPPVTTYNHLDIPFAYPPLGFYFTGLLAHFTGWNLLDIYRILPAVFTVLAIPAFYLLAKELVDDDFLVAISTFIFAMLPTTFDWLIMGGGVTRAPAFLFALFTLLYINRLYKQKDVKYIFLTALFASLTVLTHPETALHTAASALVFFFFFGRNKTGILKSAAVAVVTLAFTSPWWVTVLVNHGFTPFATAAQTGWHGYVAVIKIFRFDLSHEYDLQTIGVLALIGLFWQLAKKLYFLPVWFLVIYFSEPRSAPLYITPLMALFAGFSLIQILNGLNNLGTKKDISPHESTPLDGTPSKILFAVLAGQWIFSALALILIYFNVATTTRADKSAFDWIAANTPAESRFLVITGNAPLIDSVSEWFPALTGRTSVATAQGYEWIKEEIFDDVLNRSLEFQYCRDQAISCITDWSIQSNLDYDYIYVRKLYSRSENVTEPYTSAMSDLLSLSRDYSLIYETDAVSVFHKN